MKLLDRLVRPFQEHLSEDARHVVNAAWTLRIGEFDLFRLAYRRWYHRDGEEKFLEKVFARYMFQQTVPPWVRHYCREVLARARAGSLDPHEFGADTVHRREPVLQYRRQFIAITMVAMMCLYLLFLLLM